MSFMRFFIGQVLIRLRKGFLCPRRTQILFWVLDDIPKKENAHVFDIQNP